MPDDTKKLREEIERLADAYDDLIDNTNPANALKAIALDGEIRDLVRTNRMIILAALRAVEALPKGLEVAACYLRNSIEFDEAHWDGATDAEKEATIRHKNDLLTIEAAIASRQTPTPSSSTSPPA